MCKPVLLLLLVLLGALPVFAQYDEAPLGPDIRQLIYEEKFEQAQQLIDNTAAKYGDGLAFDLLRVELAYSQNDTAKAFDMLNGLMERFPDNFSVYYHFGQCYKAAHQYSQADSMYVLAMGMSKTQYLTNYLKKARARLFIDTYNYPAAKKLLDDVLTEHPKDLYANILMGVIYIRQNDLDKAYKYTDKARKLSKSYTTENNIAAIYIRKGDYQKAIKLLVPLVKNNPNLMIALGNLGYAYTQTGRQEEGLAMLLEAADIETPIDGYFYRCLGIVYLQQNDTAKACEYFGKALEHDFTPAYGNEVLELQQKHCK